MHPYKAEGIKGHNRRLRELTRHYGAANPAMHRDSPVNYPKHDGPEDSVGYGADSSAANARGDRPGRRTKAANPVATYRTGGRVKSRADGGPVKSGGKAGKGKTNISINITPPSAPTGVSGLPMGANPAMPPPRPPMPAPMPPPGAGPGMPPPGAGMPPGAMPPGGPPGAMGPLGQAALQQRLGGMIPRKRGGRVRHSDEVADKNLIKSMVKGKALKHRARGGPVKVGLKAGAMSGEGRMTRNRHMDHKLRPTRGVEG